MEAQAAVRGALHAGTVGDDAGDGQGVADLVAVLVLAQVERVVPRDQTCKGFSFDSVLCLFVRSF